MRRLSRVLLLLAWLLYFRTTGEILTVQSGIPDNIDTWEQDGKDGRGRIVLQGRTVVGGIDTSQIDLFVFDDPPSSELRLHPERYKIENGEIVEK